VLDFRVEGRQRDVQAFGGTGLAPVALIEALETIAAAYLLMARLNSNVPSRFFVIVIQTVPY